MSIDGLVIAQQYHIAALEKELSEARYRLALYDQLAENIWSGDSDPMTCRDCLDDKTEEYLCESCWLHLCSMPQRCWKCDGLIKK